MSIITKTILQWLEGLPNPYNNQAIWNATNHAPNALNEKVDSMSDALLWAFEWDETKEGEDYWSKIQAKYEKEEYEKS